MSESVYEELARAVQAWIRQIVARSGVRGAVLGLSGGLDSCVSAALCAHALGPENVLGLVLPCGSHSDDQRDGERIADFLGIQRKTIRLDEPFEELVRVSGLDRSNSLKMGNIKARIRMTVIYAHSENRLVSGTSNRSEYLLGYWTKWGDGTADFHPLLGLYKSQVRRLAIAMRLPGWTVERVPSAGLWQGQSDEGEMGVTYDQIEIYFEKGAHSVPSEAAKRIEALHGATHHKRNSIPTFNGERWFQANG